MEELEVDGVLCISTSDSKNRRESIQAQADKIGLPVEFVIVERDVESGERGCFLAHKKCAELALERDYQRVLVLEDDVLFLKSFMKKTTVINKFLLATNPDIFYLGATLGKTWLTWNFSIVRIRSQGAYSYILSRTGCERIANLNWEGRAIDNYFSKMFKGYAVFPFIIEHQAESVLPSKIAETRGFHYTEADAARNRAKQYKSVVMNFHKTIFRVGF